MSYICSFAGTLRPGLFGFPSCLAALGSVERTDQAAQAPLPGTGRKELGLGGVTTVCRDFRAWVCRALAIGSGRGKKGKQGREEKELMSVHSWIPSLWLSEPSVVLLD